jgi:hypothetical protein
MMVAQIWLEAVVVGGLATIGWCCWANLEGRPVVKRAVLFAVSALWLSVFPYLLWVGR